MALPRVASPRPSVPQPSPNLCLPGDSAWDSWDACTFRAHALRTPHQLSRALRARQNQGQLFGWKELSENRFRQPVGNRTRITLQPLSQRQHVFPKICGRSCILNRDVQQDLLQVDRQARLASEIEGNATSGRPNNIQDPSPTPATGREAWELPWRS